MDIPLLTHLYAEHIKEVERRYAEILLAAKLDAVVIHSGSLKIRTEFDDQYWPLRATPHFQHWVPISQADCAIIFVPGKRPVLAWTRARSVWEKPARPETLHFVAALDVHEPDGWESVKALVPTTGRVAFIGEDRSRAAAWGIDAALVNLPELIGPLDRLRTRKTAYEILCLEEANRRAALGHEAVRSAFQAADRSELDLHLIFLGVTSQDDPETPYKNIVALGEHASTLHHIDYKKRPDSRSAESLLVDAGATYQGYCSDITRTWVKGTGATLSTFTGIVNGVEAMQKRLCDAVRVGAPYEKLHEDAHRQVGDILREAGILKVSSDEAMAAGISRAFFPHGLGHSLGLQCHDVGCALIKPKKENPWLRNTAPVAEGQCFTIEPGVYFIDALLAPLRATGVGAASGGIDWTLVDQLAALGGVRIEDDLVVTGGAAVTRNLTREVLP